MKINKNERINIRCTFEEKANLKRMADELNLSLSELIMYCMKEGSSYNKIKELFLKINN